MSNQNNVPTAPGWYYRQTPRGTIEPVRVDDFCLNRVFTYQWAGSAEVHSVEDDRLWAGPVPMPGEWAPMDLFNQLWTALYLTNPARGTVDYNILQRAQAWDEPEVRA